MDETDNYDQPPLQFIEQKILGHGKELAERLHNIEEEIAHRGKVLDDLKAARDLISETLMGTEKVRVQIMQQQEAREEAELQPAPSSRLRHHRGQEASYRKETI